MVVSEQQHKYMDALFNLISEQSWFGILTAAIALASAITAATPTPKIGSVVSKIYAVIEFLALNIGKAKQSGKSDDTKS